MSSPIEWGKLNDRQLLDAWEGASLMDRRQIEGELRRRMEHPGPSEEAIMAALIRETRKPKPTRKPRPKRKAAAESKPIPLAVGGWSPANDEAA